MFSRLKLQQWSFLGTHGLIQINTTYVTERKPVSSVLQKIAVSFFMLAIATALIAPPLALCMPAWKATVAMIGIVLIYLGVSFFIRPQADTEKRGWQGGATQPDSANFHRLLVALHWLLAPGRFAAETVLDTCVLLGVVQGAEVIDSAAAVATPAVPAPNPATYSVALQRPLEQPVNERTMVPRHLGQ
jgi:hypothetical protein